MSSWRKILTQVSQDRTRRGFRMVRSRQARREPSPRREPSLKGPLGRPSGIPGNLEPGSIL